MRRIVGPANPPQPIEHNASGFSAPALTEVSNRKVGGVVGMTTAIQEVDGYFCQGQPNDLFAVSRHRRSAVVVGENTTTDQGRVPHAPGKFSRQSPGGRTTGNPAS